MSAIFYKNLPYGAGGSNVEANPSGSTTGDLTKVGIDGTVYDVTDADAVHSADKGVANGVASLDATGRVPSTQLPSYVDDVLEYASESAFPATGESGKIYIALDTNKTYRWSGSAYVEISESLALGETTGTAYEGSKGKANADNIASLQTAMNKAYNTDDSAETDLQDTDYIPFYDTSATAKKKSLWSNIKAKLKTYFDTLYDKTPTLATVATSGSYNDLSNKPTIPTVNNKTLTIQKNGTQVAQFTANSASDVTANITVPTGDLASVNKPSSGQTTSYLRGDGTWQNFPTIPAAQVQSDWNQTDSAQVDFIKNKPDIDLEGSKTATGNPITLTDASESYAEELEVTLEPIQDLHGYDKPWVGGAGKNKLPMTVEGIKAANTSGSWSENVYTLNGVTFTIQTDNGENVTGIKVNGTANASTLFNIKLQCTVYGEMWLNGCPSGGSNDTYILYSEPSPERYDRGSGVSINYSSSYSVRIYIKASYNAQNLLFQPMISALSETDRTFSPYSNICPITGYTDVNVGSVGKNLSYLAGIGVYNTTTGVLEPTSPNTYAYTPKIKSKSTYYTVSCSLGFTQVLLYKWDENGNYLGWTLLYNSNETYNSTFEVTGCDVFAIVIRKSGSNVSDVSVFTNFMIEEGQQATTYEPYTSSTTHTPLGRTVYGGKLNVRTGELTVTHGIESDWSGYTFTQNREGTNAYEAYTEIVGKKRGIYNILSNALSIVSTFTDVSEYSMRGYENSSDISIKLPKNVASSAAQVKQWMIDNNIVICYELATPQTYQLTPQELKLLKQYNYITTNGTTISLKYQPDNVIGEAIGVSEEYTDRAIAKDRDEWLAVKDSSNVISVFHNITITGAVSWTRTLISKLSGYRFMYIEVTNTDYNYLALNEIVLVDTLLSGIYYNKQFSIYGDDGTITVYLYGSGQIVIGASVPSSVNSVKVSIKLIA